MSVIVHGQVVAGPAVANNLSLAKNLAAEAAQITLMEEGSSLSLKSLCDCVRRHLPPPATDEVDIDDEGIDDETDEGFAVAGQVMLERSNAAPTAVPEEEADADTEFEDDERQEVERMVQISSQRGSICTYVWIFLLVLALLSPAIAPSESLSREETLR